MNYSCLSEIMMIIFPTPTASEDYNHLCRQYNNLKYTMKHKKRMSSTGSQMEKLRHRQRKWITPQSQCYSDPCSHLGLSPMRVETTPVISVDFFHLCTAVTISTDGLQQHSGSVIMDQCPLVLHKTNQKIWTKWNFLVPVFAMEMQLRAFGW